MDLAGRTALVTGGANGIGRELTRQLVAAGAARIWIVGRDAGRLAEAEAEAAGVVRGIRADLAVPAEVDMLLSELRGRAPELSLVINNAGIQHLTDLIAGDPAELLARIRGEIEINFAAVVALSIGLLPLLRAQPSAALVNVTSGLALSPKKSAPTYCATKAGIRSFTKGLRYQCRDRAPQMRVIEALPPLVDTDMTRGRGTGKLSPEECARQIVAGILADREEIFVGKSALLRIVQRVSPALADRILRDS